MKGDPAPIYADAFSLCEWLLGRLDGHGQVLARQICEDALAVLESVGLALGGRSVGAHLDHADERLIALRLKLRLAAARGLLTDDQLVFAFTAADAVGRQLGGWLRTLGPA